MFGSICVYSSLSFRVIARQVNLAEFCVKEWAIGELSFITASWESIWHPKKKDQFFPLMNLKGQVNSNICCQVSCPYLGLVTVVMHRITYATALKAFPSTNARDRSVQCLSLLVPYPNAVISYFEKNVKKAKQAQQEQHGASTRVKIISLIFTAVLKVMGRPCPSRWQGQVWCVCGR